MQLSLGFLRQTALAFTSVLALGLLAGCAMISSPPSDSTISRVSGAVHGGQSPIQGATVTLYVTSNAATGYGQAATLIGTSSTDANGTFTIAPSATPSNCPAGQQAYITSAGGYPSGSPSLANNSILLMAALGDCSAISASTTVQINEVTTVAAGYALSGFMTTSANGSLYEANVSAPAANRAATGTISGAAGLAHAFLNASNIVSYASGMPNIETPQFVVGGVGLSGQVPAVEINTLADILQSCVNAATGNAQCVTLYSDTPSISGVAPTNTLQSMINLARNPYPSAAAMTGASNLNSLITAQAAFQPHLTIAPPDWTLPVVYSNAVPFVASYDTVLDANDTVWQDAGGGEGVWGLNAYGTGTPSLNATGGIQGRQLAVDALGNLWLSSDYINLLQYSTSVGGNPTNTYTPYGTITSSGISISGVAVDKNNNVWVTSAYTGSPNITELAYNSSNSTYSANYTATAPGGFEPLELTVDPNQNIWMADYFTQGTLAAVLPNLSAANSSATPTYTVSGLTITPVSATFASNAAGPLGLVIDASGNAWYGTTFVSGTGNTVTTTGIEEVVPTLTSSVITSLSPQPLIANATLGAKASNAPGIDGAGVIYVPDNKGAAVLGVHVYSTQALSSTNTGTQVVSPPSGFLGCFPSSITKTCGAGIPSNPYAVYNPTKIVVDSTGSVWASIGFGGLTQMIGLGAPSWPLQQTGKPGLSPGLSTVSPLP